MLTNSASSALAKANSETADEEFETKLAKLRQPLAILLAEDNATNQLVFIKLMQGNNVDITVAANGRIALEHAAHRAFDVVFMDMRMPEVDGLEATRAIRALEGASARVPIIALTANAFADDIKACRDAGMDAFIAKPVRKKILIEKLAGLLGDDQRFRDSDVTPDDGVATALPVTPPAEVALADVAPLLDRAELDTFIEEIELDGVRATLDVYLEETVERLALMRRLSVEADRAKIETEPHTLKGSSSTFGLTQLATLGRTLEYAAHQIAPEDYRDLLDRIEAAFAASRDAVEAAMSEHVG